MQVESALAHSMESSTLVELLRGRARSAAGRHGYTFEAASGETQEYLSFYELDRRAQAIAAGVRRMINSGDRVLLSYGPGLDFIQAFFGCLYADAIPVPIEMP